MVKIREKQMPVLANGSINYEIWLSHIAEKLDTNNINLLRNACILAQLAGEEEPNFCGESCLHQGLVMAEVLADLNLDQETIAAAIIHSSVQYADLSREDIQEHLGDTIADLINGVSKMDAVSTLEHHSSIHDQDHVQIDSLRRMLLAMVEDVRVVLIKLAERVYMMRVAHILSNIRRPQLAKETLAIYAPLASRLGIGQLKWELEDLSFRYIDPETYKRIAKLLASRRIDRDKYVENVIATLEEQLHKEGIHAPQIHGRAKHIYSIYRKMQRKNIDFAQIYDATAVRVLVPTIKDCYTVLSTVHSLWKHIPEEFDDYVATPKPNGYRSIHTAVVGPENKNIEVQIRTFDMHEESELGVAAHWIYKEGGTHRSGYEEKIAWLRQVLEWQQELSEQDQPLEEIRAQAFDDRVYVFTPANHIVDLPRGSTPVDFAYNIHSEVGHRCRGAKINGKIVPLTHKLSTGEQVEIITAKEAGPSRDWLNPHHGYLKSSRAKAKILHWFKQQDYDKNLARGEDMFAQELKRLNIDSIDIDKLAPQLNYKSGRDVLAALGCGDVRITQIHSLLQAQLRPSEEIESKIKTQTRPRAKKNKDDITVSGVGNLLTHIARCCKPVPGDPIIGYITFGRGVSIHNRNCPNIVEASKAKQERLVEVEWGEETKDSYPVDILITANDRAGVARDITNVLSNAKVSLLALNTEKNKTENIVTVSLTIEIDDISQLSRILEQMNQLPNVHEVKRKRD